MDLLEEEAVHLAVSQGTKDKRPRGPNIRGSSTGNIPKSNERPTQDTNTTGRSDSRKWSHANQGRSHRSYSDWRENPEPLAGGNDVQAGHSRDATSLATSFEPLNRSLETFLTRLSRTNERSEKSRRFFKKPRCYKVESDGCLDTWIEVMKLHFEEEDLSERQGCTALTSNLEVTALNCVVAKKQYQRDTAEKIFEILLNRFGSGVQGLGKAFFTNPEGSQSGRVANFCQSAGVLLLPIQKGPIFANPEGSYFCQSGRVKFLPIRKGPIFVNPEGSIFCQFERVQILSIRKGPIFANPEGSFFDNPEGSNFSNPRGPVFANPEGSYFCQFGRVQFLSIRKGPIFVKT